jgi:hypothetical protein
VLAPEAVELFDQAVPDLFHLDVRRPRARNVVAEAGDGAPASTQDLQQGADVFRPLPVERMLLPGSLLVSLRRRRLATSLRSPRYGPEDDTARPFS